MKIFLRMIILMSILIHPAFSQHEGSEDFSGSDSQFYDENVDLTYLPEFQEEITEIPELDYGSEFAVEDEMLSEQELAYE